MSKNYNRDELYRKVKILAPCKESLTWIKSLPEEVSEEELLRQLATMPDGPEFLVRYCYCIVHEPRKAAEEIILTSASAAVSYATAVLKSRWSALEDRLLKGYESRWCYTYARDVIKGRWEEAEGIIQLDPKYWDFYKTEILGEPRDANRVVETLQVRSGEEESNGHSPVLSGLLEPPN